MNEQGKVEACQPAGAENQGAVQEAIDSCPVSAIALED
ncbi:4Fe-4S domain-containing protein [Mediterraneibacter glycyrrhizinilyticus]